MRRKIILCATLAVLLIPHTSVAEQPDRCVIPGSLSDTIRTEYPNMHVVSLLDLDEDDRKQFQREHGSNCPGLTRVDFYGDGKPTFALVLLRGDARKAELVIAHELQNQWRTTLLETADASVPVVWSEKPGTYEDVYGEKKLNATRPVVVLWGDNNTWAIVYAWTGKQVEKIWIRD